MTIENTYTMVNDYDDYLIKNNFYMDILTYITKINLLKYNINHQFIIDFIPFINNDNCYISYAILKKYGIFSANKIYTSIYINKFIKINKLIINKDYKLDQNKFYLHICIFKTLLSKMSKLKQYSYYYAILEKYTQLYFNYKNKLNNINNNTKKSNTKTKLLTNSGYSDLYVTDLLKCIKCY